VHRHQIPGVLHVCCVYSNQCTVVSEKELSENANVDFGIGLKASLIEELDICTILMSMYGSLSWKAHVSIYIRSHYAEQCRSQHVTLIDSVEWNRHLSAINEMTLYGFVQLSYFHDECIGASKVGNNFPDSLCRIP